MEAGLIHINPEEVVHETVDGEVILIALQTGCYYSLEGAGAEVWGALMEGRSPADAVAELEARYDAAPGEIRTAVLELVERLVEERLVVTEAGSVDAPPPSVSANGARKPFPHPVLHKFTDMQDFLLVDPIHDVGQAGWPHSPAVQ